MVPSSVPDTKFLLLVLSMMDSKLSYEINPFLLRFLLAMVFISTIENNLIQIDVHVTTFAKIHLTTGELKMLFKIPFEKKSIFSGFLPTESESLELKYFCWF